MAYNNQGSLMFSLKSSYYYHGISAYQNNLFVGELKESGSQHILKYNSSGKLLKTYIPDEFAMEYGVNFTRFFSNGFLQKKSYYDDYGILKLVE